MTDLSDHRERLLERLLAQRGLAAAKHEIPRRPEGAVVPLSGNQRGLWLTSRLGLDAGAYAMFVALRVAGEVDPARLRTAVGVVVQRHEALRTRIAEREGVAQQVVESRLSVDVPVTDLGDQDLQSVVASEVDTPFDLETGPLLRVRLVRVAPGDSVVVVTGHHIVCDDLSLGIVAQEIGEVYAGAELGAEGVQFPDYTHWQADRLADGERQRQLDHWAERLAGAPDVLDLASDRPRNRNRTVAGGSHRFVVPAGLADRLAELTRAHGCTTFAGMLAVFSIVLSRRSQSGDLVIGSPTTHRPFPELERSVGMFVTTTALRMDLSGDPTVAELFGRAKSTAVDALDHAEVSFDEVAARVAPRRDLAHHPLFQVMLVLNRGGASDEWAGMPAEVLPVDRGTSRFDLTLHVRETDGDWPANLDYSTDLFEPDTVARLADQVLAVLEAVVRHPDARLSALDTTTEADRIAAAALNGPARAAAPADVLTRIGVQVAEQPDTTAVLALHADGTAAGELTFGQLDRRANRVAQVLVESGVRTEVPVGLALRAGPDALVALLAILKAGGAYVPLDPGHPPVRLAGLLADCGAPVVITAPGSRDRFPEFHGVLLDTADDAFRGEAAEPPGVEVARQGLAYVIYTSGSTGVPKGVQVQHDTLANLTDAFIELHDFGAGQRILMIPPLSFDASVGDVFPAWCAGAAVVVHPEPATVGGADLLRLCAEHRLTAVDAPAALWKRWVADLEGVTDAGGPLRVMMIGGEAVPPQAVADWAKATGVALVNHYGPTETTVCVTAYRTVDAAEVDPRSATLPIGRPLAGVRTYVLDGNLRPSPVGVPGQLYVGGTAPARGYRGDPGRTASVYVPDPRVPGGRMYRTGDLVRLLPGGTLEFLGRVDDQVKLRGHRIEPGEVRAALLKHPGVAEAAVAVRADTLVAYVVPRDDAPELDELRAFCAEHLPEAMLPGARVVMAELPLTAHGKVDVAKLPEPDVTAAPYEPPQTPVERALAEIWGEVLNAPLVGRHDSFFGLGGHSLVAAAVLAKVRQLLGVTVPLRALFATADLAELAEVVEHAASSDHTFAKRYRSGLPSVEQMRLDAVPPADIEARFPLRTGTPERVLLTGATGFLGAHLLGELLTRTDAEVHCLVRAETPAVAAARIRANLRRAHLDVPEEQLARVVPIIGDLSKPLLGLTEREFDGLAESMDAVYHNGAVMNFVLTYEWMMPPHVGSTIDVLRLATRYATKPLHLMSTLGVFLGATYDKQLITEADRAEDPTGLDTGYHTTKWVADMMGVLARDRGVPVSVHRIAAIVGDVRTGTAKTESYLSRQIATCAHTGAVPRTADVIDMLPVDRLAGAIAGISTRPEPAGRDFHYYRADGFTYADLGEVLNAKGYPAKVLEYPEWRALMLENPDSAFGPLAFGLTATHRAHPVFDCSATWAAAAECGVEFPPADAEMIARHVDYLASAGVMPERS
ncbi:amino acid adenylation domain-containing protein/thioester reductase-like protein [Saccharothrix tamanrassetensis]|uniref:Amino acid adenylation domain-containing protein/thioester reductase-like protein n=1 Tax=Saccharothrix tamanrassetensis TaxID=1051531 RepID=A0A841CHL5_9PSEU|nr:non-ribosomal peptide synthetase [Saccharothrix tamanrassetensis]MBB5958032.1 amino acid adenylation domain-containing protein/thioester reductase-like protein [Saccharothrix tamanrassetensis]